MSEHPSHGFPIVLTADRTLMADYRVLFDGMLSASQTTTTPDLFMRLLLARPLWGGAVHARRAPIGLRRIEAALLDGVFSRDDVADALDKVEANPESKGRQTVLEEELTTAGAAQDEELLKAAQDLLAQADPESTRQGAYAITQIAGDDSIQIS